MPTHYEILGVASDADIETIRRSYVALAKANHPDRRQTEDDTRRSRADDRIRAANAAWHVLRDPQRRDDYDRSLRHGSSVGAGSTAAAASGAGAPGATRPRPKVVGARPAPPSGIVVPASQASLWRYVPVAVLLVVLVAVLVVSAYATSGGSAPGQPVSPDAVPVVGDCVLVVMISAAKGPAPVACGTAGSARVSAVVDTPRPCPTGTEPVAVAGGKTTLCLQF